MTAMTILTLVLATQAGQHKETFTVGSASAGRGQMATGTIDVPAGSDAALAIPVAVVHGARPGPVLAIVSGAHGTEYASIIAVERLIRTLDPKAVSGTVVLVPLVNVPSFEQKVPHVNPSDGKSMNRFYVGKVIYHARSPESGVVLYIRAVPSMTKGETVANIGVVAREP